MRKEHLIAYFGSSIAAARALGISKQAVSNWRKVVPEGMAYKAEVLTDGALRVDPHLYEKRRGRH